MSWILILSIFFVQFAWTGPLAIERSNGWLDGWSGAKSLAGQIAASVQDVKPKDLQMGFLLLPMTSAGSAYYKHVTNRQKRIQELQNRGVGSGNSVQALSKGTQKEDAAELLRLLNLGIRWEEKEEEEDPFALGAEKLLLEKPTEKVSSENGPKMRMAPVKEVPAEFRCPITTEIMEDPVAAADGFSYERSAIEHWINQRRNDGMVNSPMTGAPLANLNLVPNITLRNLIRDSKTKPSFPEQLAFIYTPVTAGVKPHGILEARDVRRCEWKPGRAETLASLEEVVAMSARVNEEGWRLPSIWELFVLSQQPNLRDDLKTGIVWSTTQFDRSSALCINFADRSLRLNGLNESQAIHQVRSMGPVVSPPVTMTEKMLTDPLKRAGAWYKGPRETREVGALEWELGRKGSNDMTFKDAQAYVASRAADGWRLPTIWELEALYQQQKALGEDLDTGWFWSDTMVAGLDGTHWSIGFNGGIINYICTDVYASKVRLCRSERDRQ